MQAWLTCPARTNATLDLVWTLIQFLLVIFTVVVLGVNRMAKHRKLKEISHICNFYLLNMLCKYQTCCVNIHSACFKKKASTFEYNDPSLVAISSIFIIVYKTYTMVRKNLAAYFTLQNSFSSAKIIYFCNLFHLYEDQQFLVILCSVICFNQSMVFMNSKFIFQGFQNA